MLRVGVLSAGRIGRAHAAAISGQTGSDLVAVSDLIADNAALPSDEYGLSAHTRDDIINDPSRDAVLDAASTDTHATAADMPAAKPMRFVLERRMPAYRAECGDLVQAIEGKSEMPVVVADGVNALAMADASKQSYRTGAPVHMADLA